MPEKTAVSSAPVDDVESHVHPDEPKLAMLLEQGDVQAAFFLARRLLASGESWAEPWLERIQSEMK